MLISMDKTPPESLLMYKLIAKYANSVPFGKT